MRRNGWYGDSYRHYLASKGVKSAGTYRSYMRWKQGPMVSDGERAVPSFLMWRTPKEDMFEAIDEVSDREEVLRKRVLDSVLGRGQKMSASDADAYLREQAELKKQTNKLLSVKKKELEEKEWLKPIPFPARASDIWEDAAAIEKQEELERAKRDIEVVKAQKEDQEKRTEAIKAHAALKDYENKKLTDALYATWMLEDDQW